MKKLRDMSVFIVGLGQVGGSLGLDIVKRRLAARVIGFDSNASVMARARRRGIVHTTVPSLEAGLRRADLIVLAVPLGMIIKLISRIAPSIGNGVAILDVGSTKREILEAVVKSGLENRYIGGHPIAGTEKHGLAAVVSGMFKNATFVLTPTDLTPKPLIRSVRELVRGLGATPLVMTAAEHDQLIALTSNLPYLVSLALVRLVDGYARRSPDIWRLIGGSLRSATRVADSAQELTMDMFLSNRDNIPWVVEEAISQLSGIAAVIEQGNKRALLRLVSSAQRKNGRIQHG